MTLPHDSDAPIRWGILATGWIAKSFTEDLKLLPGAIVAAVGSRSQESAERFAATHAIPRAHGSWAALADDPEVDVVYVATPHPAHFAATKLCLEAGKAVLCEKPFTLDRESTAALVDLARSRDLFLMEAMWTRANPAIRRVAELVADGAIGEVTSVYADFGIQGPFDPTHRIRSLELGGGALLDLGVYPITLAHLLLGVPDEIRSWAKLNPEGSDAHTGMILGYESGALALLQCGIVGETSQRASIIGTTGRIEIPRLFFRPDRFTLARGDQAEEFEVPYLGNGMNHEAAEVMRCLRAGEKESPLVPHQTSLEVMGILDAVRAQIGVRYPAGV
jgi:predicted dehydrogenase